MTKQELQDQQKEQLMEAYDRLNAKTAAEVRKNIYVSLTYFWVNQAPPESFTRAIRYGEEYVGNPLVLPSAEVCVNLAVAYTQKASQLKDQSGAKEVDAGSKKLVLDAIDKALRIDDSWQIELAKLLDKQLKIFAADEDIRKRIGLLSKPSNTEKPSGNPPQPPASGPQPEGAHSPQMSTEAHQ
jgi:hypothetical protein